jgi:outer membrane immunogenic protein
MLSGVENCYSYVLKTGSVGSGDYSMKKLLVACIAAAAFCGAPALAADMPVKAPPPAPAPSSYDLWVGFYTGGSIGGRWSQETWTTLNFGSSGPATNIDNPVNFDATRLRLGGYIGYNWRIASSWLAGLEADIASADSSGSHTPFPGGIIYGSAPGFDLVTAKLGWDGSVRARLGVLVNPTWLVYGTGGVAWQEIKTTSTCAVGSAGYCAVPVTGSTSTDKAGWTIGGGVETALTNHWLARIEYRYADFGNVTNVLPPAPHSGMISNVSVKTNTALLGLAYKW